MTKRASLPMLLALGAMAWGGVAAAEAGGGQGNAAGTPQRAGEPPAGLLKVLTRGNPGILRALLATEGSNSRLQDLPDSP